MIKPTLLRTSIALLAASSLAACSTVSAPSPADPFESYNRSIDGFNYTIDAAVTKPVAKAYVAVVPEAVRGCVTNFFGNISDVFVGVNNLIQGKPAQAGSDLCRVAINSTVGVLGLFDVATKAGFQKHEEDFGQTFGVWGVSNGPYFVLPFLGPSTFRDTAGTVLDSYTNPLRYINDIPTRNVLYATRIIDTRANLLPASDLVEQVALDRYSFVREAYLARRRTQVYDGNPPADSATTRAKPSTELVEFDSSLDVVGWEAARPTVTFADLMAPAAPIGPKSLALVAQNLANKSVRGAMKAPVVSSELAVEPLKGEQVEAEPRALTQ